MGCKTTNPTIDIRPPAQIASLGDGAIRMRVVDQPIHAAPVILFQRFQRRDGIKDRVTRLLQGDDFLEAFLTRRKIQEQSIIPVIRIVELDGYPFNFFPQETNQIGDFRIVAIIDGEVGKDPGMS